MDGPGTFAFSNRKMPVRLINIKKTLACTGGICFTEPCNWDFHVISHTWSLEIRKLSEEIGSKILGCGDSNSYNRVFAEDVDLRENECYQDLMEFLSLLETDGVEEVWFDALCINQMDTVEKNWEIMHMGQYYTRSRGCYVANHGIGKGYKVVAKDEMGTNCLPRWFTRAWTLQEYLLPRSLTFIVDSLSPRSKQLLNECMRETSSAMLCICNYDQIRRKVEEKWGNKEEFREGAAEIIGSSDSSRRCNRCGKASWIRKASTNGEIYFVTRDTYHLLVEVVDGTFERDAEATVYGDGLMPNGWTDCKRKIVSYQREQLAMLEFMVRNFHLRWKPNFILSLIRRRKFSEEEDVLLSVLKLLGLEGRMQVRTGKTLEEQMVEVAKVAAKVTPPNLLVELCVMDVVSGAKAGMSWAPDIKRPVCGHVPEMDLAIRNELRSAVEVVEVTQGGRLRLRGKAVGGRLVFQRMCRVAPATKQIQSGCYLKLADGSSFSFGARQAAPAGCRFDGCCVRRNVKWLCGHQHEVGGLFLPVGFPYCMLPLDVWILLLGKDSRPGGCCKVMVCVGNIGGGGDQQLHKIGVLSICRTTCDIIFGPASPTIHYLLGGFGSPPQVRALWEALAKTHPYHTFHIETDTHCHTRCRIEKASNLLRRFRH